MNHKPLNDLMLTEHIGRMHRRMAVVDLYWRNDQEKTLFLAIKDIVEAGQAAMERMNDLRFYKEKKDGARDGMVQR